MQTLRRTPFALVLLALLLSFSCSEEEPVTLQRESVQFSVEIPLQEDEDGRTSTDIPLGSRVVIELLTPSGTIKEDLEILRFGQSYMTDPIELSVGAHKVTSFLIVDHHYKVIFAAPKEQSRLATAVVNALPQSFNIHKGKIKNLAVQVIGTANRHPLDFGYSTFVVEGQPEATLHVTIANHNAARTYLTYGFSGPGSMHIDWGDDTITEMNFNEAGSHTVFHDLPTQRPLEFTIKLKGNLDLITSLTPASFDAADLSSLINLRSLQTAGPLEELDLSNQKRLEELFIDSNIEHLVLGDNKPLLDYFYLTVDGAISEAMFNEIERHIQTSNVRNGIIVFWGTEFTEEQMIRLRAIRYDYAWVIYDGFSEIE